MIEINIENRTYKCPYCGHLQSYYYTHDSVCNVSSNYSHLDKNECANSTYSIFSIQCQNKKCNRITVVAVNRNSGKQIDIEPQYVIKRFPEYIPEQIRQDYEEAITIIDLSPKAAATLLRRCLQGMIRDFWEIKADNLYNEISKLKDKVPNTQWAALDGMRKLGNIGAHMEKDVDLIIGIDPDEAKKLAELIALLLEKWYVSRHDEQELLNSIVKSSESKEQLRETH